MPLSIGLEILPQMRVCYTEVHSEVDRPLSDCQKSRKLDVSTPLTSTAGHLRGLLPPSLCARAHTDPPTTNPNSLVA